MLKKLFQESEEIPPDYTRLFNSRLFSISTTVRTGELLMMIYVITMMTTTNTGSSSRNPGLQGAWGETRTTQVRLKYLDCRCYIRIHLRLFVE